MRISEQGLEKIKQREGVVLRVYLDSAGKKTAGMGHLLHENSSLKVGDTITKEQSDEWARVDIGIAERCVNTSVNVRLVQDQFDALCSFVFNVGCAAFKSSTLLKLLNNRDYTGAKGQFSRWHYVTVGGKKKPSDGLMNRRIAEAAQFGSVGPQEQAAVKLVSTSVAEPPKKVLETTTGKLQATAVVTGGTVAIIQGITQAMPALNGINQVNMSVHGMPPWLMVVSVLLVVGCIGACVMTIVHKKKTLLGE